MSRSGTPRRSTRSQSRDLDSLSDGEVGIASSSAIPARKTSRQRKPTSRPTSERKEEETIIEEEDTVTETGAQYTQPTVATSSSGLTSSAYDDVQAPLMQPPNKLRARLSYALTRSVRLIPFLPPLLLLAATLLLIVLPTPEKPFRRNVYVDENALQPGSASIEWNWGEVEFADQVSERIRNVAGERAEVRAAFLTHELRSIGFTPYNQSYRFSVPRQAGQDVLQGVNTYTRWSAARGDGREAFVIAVPWKSAWDGRGDPDAGNTVEESNKVDGALSEYERKQKRRPNVRGVATALTIARYLIGFRHWSKDLIFVFGDGELDGMQAWTSRYFGREQKNLQSDDLHGRGSLVWNALSIDYPSDSFSHFVLKHEGLNGQLPNMDVISSLTHIVHRAGGMPVVLPASSEDAWPEYPLGRFGDLLEKHAFRSGDGARKYLSGMWNAAFQMGLLSLGRPTGVHGLFHRYHVDAITIFARPAKGPFGFWHMGRAVESFARSMSNLLERLHHSHFFYILTSPDRFVEVAKYMPVSIFFSAALLITGITIWLDEGRRARIRQDSLIAMIKTAITHEHEGMLENSYSNGDLVKHENDVPLEHPTAAQRTSSLVSMLVQRSARRGVLVGTTKVRSMAALMDIHGRPAGAGLAIVLGCHAVSLAVLVRMATTPIDCAKDGVEHCKPLRLISALLVASLALIMSVAGRRATKGFLNYLARAQAMLPEEAIESVFALRSFRTRSVARTAFAIALMEAGIITLIISLVNFSLAAMLGALLSFACCSASIPASEQGIKQDHLLINPPATVPRDGRHLSPASDDSDAVEAALVAEPQSTTALLRLRMGLQAIAFAALSPTFAVLAFKAAQAAALHLLPDRLPIWLTDTTIVDRSVDNALWDYQVLSSALLPILSIVYLPILLVCATSSLLIVAH